MNTLKLVEDGYDHIADRYLATKTMDDSVTMAALEVATRDLPDGAIALDLGCGAGVPVTQWLARRFDVTGVDLSARQLELARHNVPTAHFVKGEMTALDFAPSSFDVIVAFYSIIHVPREQQPALAEHIARWLKPGGRFLATWAIGEWEGTETNWEGWGAAMWWSHFGADANLAMLRDAGFAIRSATTQTSGDETWLWVLGQKVASSPHDANEVQ